jgi:CBS domain-containing protein
MAVARTVMKTDVVSATPDESVASVAQRMRDRGVGAVLVVADGALKGIFSERDVMTRIVAESRDPNGTTVGEVATTHPVTVEAETHIRRCAEILREQRCRHLPVVEGSKPVGMISARDFFAYVVEGLEAFIDKKRYQEQLDEGLDPYEGFGGSYGA